jgi:hypothetical protein
VPRRPLQQQQQQDRAFDEDVDDGGDDGGGDLPPHFVMLVQAPSEGARFDDNDDDDDDRGVVRSCHRHPRAWQFCCMAYLCIVVAVLLMLPSLVPAGAHMDRYPGRRRGRGDDYGDGGDDDGGSAYE